MPKIKKPSELTTDWQRELVRKGFLIPSYAIITEISYEYHGKLRAKWIIGGIEYEAVQMTSWYDDPWSNTRRRNGDFV